MIEFMSIKDAMRFINKSETELTIRKNNIYNTQTNELVATVKFK